MKQSFYTAVVLLSLVLMGQLIHGAPPVAFSPAQIDYFERRVRPLLVEKCLACHGSRRQESGLRLDQFKFLMQGGERGPALVPGMPDRSLLMEAVRRKGDLEMPPKKPLTIREIQLLENWIAQGAAWPEAEVLVSADAESHWAFQPVVSARPPTMAKDDWSRNEVDSFVLDRLARARLEPSGMANRRTLARRLSLDLTGLPPTPERLQRFLDDRSPDAYARLVDSLLASPQFGERWARHWLDLARYADNKGYVFFEDKKYPWAYAYRDYVVEAFNRDLPFDQFIIEQLAADQLPASGSRRNLRAMGFLTVGPHFMNNTHDIIDDRIDLITRGLMGLTVSCARCHDHKFDPIPQANYYSLYGVLRSSHEPLVPPLFEDPSHDDKYREFTVGLAEREKHLAEYIKQKHTELVKDARTRISDYLMAAYGRRNQPPTDDFMLLTDKDSINPSMVLRWQVYLEDGERQEDPVWSVWHHFARLEEDLFEEQARKVWSSLFDQQKGLPDNLNRIVRERFQTEPPESMQQVAEIYAAMLKEIDAIWQGILAQETDPDGSVAPALADSDQEQLRMVLYGPNAPANVPVVFGWGLLDLFPDRTTQEELKKRLKALETWSTETDGAPPRAMVLLENSIPFQAQIFLRGNPSRRGMEVPAEFLDLLPGDPVPLEHGKSRLKMARAIVSPENPLTARVIVNRIWAHYFGQGLVETPSDFGLRTKSPSHPKLLDALASRLYREGVNRGSLKDLHRLIVTSATYRQASHDRPDCRRVDPENRLLWKMNRLRLEFEPLRDSLLAVSGQLDLSIGGRPVDQLGSDWNPRRTLYGFIDRMDPPPLLTTFDFPNPVSSAAERSETTVAPQALYLMNHGFIAQVVSRLMERPDVVSLGDPDARIERLFEIILGRLPDDEERQIGLEFIGEQADRSRWEHYVQALLMTNEFAFRD